MFQSVTQDADNVYFTLSDGTVITIAKGSGGADQPNSDFIFTITYMPNGGEGEVVVDTVVYGEAYSIRSDINYKKDGYYYYEWNTDPNGNGVSYNIWKAINSVTRNITLYAKWRAYDGIENGYYYVDLGLPSGLKWASCNVGATKTEGYGDYFAWGEVEPKEVYSWSTYKWCNGSYDTMTKYRTKDNKTVLDKEDDAASVNMGGSWRMPTYDELNELKTKCTWTWISNYNGTGVAGRIVTSKINGNSIFLPAAGYRSNSDLYNAGSDGRCWSSSRNTSNSDYACYLRFDSGYVGWLSSRRYYGRSVRGVLP